MRVTDGASEFYEAIGRRVAGLTHVDEIADGREDAV
jgi:hypothetical protein